MIQTIADFLQLSDGRGGTEYAGGVGSSLGPAAVRSGRGATAGESRGGGAWIKRASSERVRDSLSCFPLLDAALARHAECRRMRAQLNEEGQRVFPEQTPQEAVDTDECIRKMLLLSSGN